MNRNVSNNINIELTQEDFIKNLEQRKGNYTCLDIVGAISKLHQYEEFDFYKYENENSLEEYIAVGNAEDEDCDLKICLDCVTEYLQDTITGNLFMTLDNGLVIQIF